MHVLQDGKAREDARNLKRAAYAKGEYSIGCCISDGGSIETYAACILPFIPCDHIKQGGFA